MNEDGEREEDGLAVPYLRCIRVNVDNLQCKRLRIHGKVHCQMHYFEEQSKRDHQEVEDGEDEEVPLKRWKVSKVVEEVKCDVDADNGVENSSLRDKLMAEQIKEGVTSDSEKEIDRGRGQRGRGTGVVASKRKDENDTNVPLKRWKESRVVEEEEFGTDVVNGVEELSLTEELEVEQKKEDVASGSQRKIESSRRQKSRGRGRGRGRGRREAAPKRKEETSTNINQESAVEEEMKSDQSKDESSAKVRKESDVEEEMKSDGSKDENLQTPAKIKVEPVVEESESTGEGMKTERRHSARAAAAGIKCYTDSHYDWRRLLRKSGNNKKLVRKQVKKNEVQKDELKKNEVQEDKLEKNGVHKDELKKNEDGAKKPVTVSNMCHQCQRNDRGEVVRCTSCKTKRYCLPCIGKWYQHMSHEEIAESCPFCRRNCNCKACLRRYGILEETNGLVTELTEDEQFSHSIYLVHHLLPILKQIDQEQKMEKEAEARILGISLAEVELRPLVCLKDERVYCNNCNTSIFDIYRTCPSCEYDLCVSCCVEIRKRCISEGREENEVGMQPDWNVEQNGNIFCPPKEIGGCGSGFLELKRMFPENWVSEMAKKAQEIASEHDLLSENRSSTHLCSCFDFTGEIDLENKKIRRAADREDSNDNYLYCPSAEGIKQGDLSHFQKHWINGEPIIVEDVLKVASGLSWEPMVMWRAIREKTNSRVFNQKTQIIEGSSQCC